MYVSDKTHIVQIDGISYVSKGVGTNCHSIQIGHEWRSTGTMLFYPRSEEGEKARNEMFDLLAAKLTEKENKDGKTD